MRSVESSRSRRFIGEVADEEDDDGFVVVVTGGGGAVVVVVGSTLALNFLNSTE